MTNVIVFLLIFLASMVIAQSYNSNGNPNDTPSGTNVTALCTQETLSYKDLGGSQMATVEPASCNITHVCSPEYGFSGPGSLSDLSVSPGDIVYHYYIATNEGNANDNYTLRHYFTQEAGAAGWAVEAWEGGSFIQTLEAGTSTSEIRTVNDNTDKPFNYRVVVSSEVTGAPNGSYIIVLTTVETASIYTGKYQGANNYYYSGVASASDSVRDDVAAPILTLTRTSTVDSPTTYTGGRHDAVPGAVITFTMEYNNTGGASAESVVLVDMIPTNTKLAHVNTTGTTASVEITAAQGNATGWIVKYSTLDSPDKTYGNTADWSGGNGGTIGTLTTGFEEFPGSNATYVTTDAPYDAKWIKWEKYYVSAAENKTLTWGATIR